MKKLLLMIGLLLPSCLMAQADYRVIFDLTSKDSLDQKAVIRWINEVSTLAPQAKMEVVMFAKGIEMVVKDKSAVGKEVAKLAANKNVSFKVCEVAMKNQNVNKSQLIAGVETVPDGIYEIISKQKEGWGYIKATVH